MELVNWVRPDADLTILDVPDNGFDIQSEARRRRDQEGGAPLGRVGENCHVTSNL